jgi:hypothetical protein
MRNLSIVTALVISSMTCGFAQSRDTSLRVGVRSDSGAVVKRACITVVRQDREIYFTHTDKKGRVNFNGLPPGNYRVIAKADGFVAEKREIVIGSDRTDVEFSLRPREDR